MTVVDFRSSSRLARRTRGIRQYGRYRGELSTKIHTLVDALGNAVGVILSGGQPHARLRADHPPPTTTADMLLADKAYDADERVLDVPKTAGKSLVVPPKANQKIDLWYDPEMYRARLLVERFSADLKQFRAIATRPR